MGPASSNQSPIHPTLRANPYPEVTDLFCRLPLSTLFYQLEAAHLGDLMRLWVRPGVRIKSLPQIFKGPRQRTGHPTGRGAFPALHPLRRVIRFQGSGLLLRKENSSRGHRRRLWAHLCCHTVSTSWCRNINLLPFRPARLRRPHPPAQAGRGTRKAGVRSALA